MAMLLCMCCLVLYDNIKSCCKKQGWFISVQTTEDSLSGLLQRIPTWISGKNMLKKKSRWWTFYCSANIVLKTLHGKYLNRLVSLIRSSCFEEPKKCGLGNFWTNLEPGQDWKLQSFQNRLVHLRLINWMTQIKSEFCCKMPFSKKICVIPFL